MSLPIARITFVTKRKQTATTGAATTGVAGSKAQKTADQAKPGATKGEPVEIGILIYPGAQLAAVYGLTDLFAVAGRLVRAHRPGGTDHLRITHWRSDDTGAKIICVHDTHPATPPQPQFMLLPPSLAGLPPDTTTTRLATWLKAQHTAGVVLGSVCLGAFLLAETGLLRGRSATTHWSQAEALASRFPDIEVDTGKLIIDDGDVITAGGIMAWTDLGLRLVERLFGPTVTLETARFLLVDPAGREQRFYSSFSPNLHHGDEAVLKVQHWLQRQGRGDVTLTAMAAQAGLEERTFLRRFHKATGLKPTEYRQHLRVGKAREMLELTNRSVEQIAWHTGYEDVGAFRKVFHKVVGLSPSDYRRRFAVTQAARQDAQ